MSVWEVLRDMVAQSIGEWDTSGDDADPTPDEWDGGRLTWARWSPAHAGRVGRAIRPWAVVVHTTDMRAETFDALVKAWGRSAGKGNAAHFVLGRTPAEGLVQLIDCGRNGNHAGGTVHGWFTSSGKQLHPNAVSVGIEVHNAGEVRKVGGLWRTGSYDNGWHPHGAPLASSDVVVDPKRPERGVHRPTEWQMDELRRLLVALGTCPVMTPYPDGWGVQPYGDPAPWAPQGVIAGRAVVGHHTLSPSRKGDPHRFLSEWVTGVAASGA